MNSMFEKDIVEAGLSEMTSEQKRQYLFEQQKKTLDSFLDRNAISKEQYDKSLGDLKKKMGITA